MNPRLRLAAEFAASCLIGFAVGIVLYAGWLADLPPWLQ